MVEIQDAILDMLYSCAVLLVETSRSISGPSASAFYDNSRNGLEIRRRIEENRCILQNLLYFFDLAKTSGISYVGASSDMRKKSRYEMLARELLRLQIELS